MFVCNGLKYEFRLILITFLLLFCFGLRCIFVTDNNSKNLTKNLTKKITIMKTTTKVNGIETKNEVLTFNEILTINKAYKEQSLFRVIDHLNKQKNVVIANNNQKLTIDQLKNLCPEYFKQAKKDKEGNLLIVDRVLFSPMVFLRAIRKAANNK